MNKIVPFGDFRGLDISPLEPPLEKILLLAQIFHSDELIVLSELISERGNNTRGSHSGHKHSSGRCRSRRGHAIRRIMRSGSGSDRGRSEREASRISRRARRRSSRRPRSGGRGGREELVGGGGARRRVGDVVARAEEADVGKVGASHAHRLLDVLFGGVETARRWPVDVPEGALLRVEYLALLLIALLVHFDLRLGLHIDELPLLREQLLQLR